MTKHTIETRNIFIAGASFQFVKIPDPNGEFWMLSTPVTQAQYVAVTGDSPFHFIGDSLPAENVSYNDIQDKFLPRFNELLSMVDQDLISDLPTEEQWEFAAGDMDSEEGFVLDEYAWYYMNSEHKTHSVGMKRPNKFGLFDMLGNVWEWTKSVYGHG